MQDYYDTLGLNSSATKDEIRRAYRILARRYHPDVNPGKESSDKFKAIAEAYKVLSDEQQKKQYDIDYERAYNKLAAKRLKAYAEQARAQFEAKSREFARQSSAQSTASTAKQSPPRDTSRKAAPTVGKSLLKQAGESLAKGLTLEIPKLSIPFLSKHKQGATNVRKSGPNSISIIEVSLTVPDAIKGVKKTIEIADEHEERKVSVTIPPGVRTGSVVRMRSKSLPGEELVLIVQLASHPYLAIERKGLIIEVPITLSEAVDGSQIQVPTLEDPVLIKIPSGSQSGTSIRVKGKGIPDREGNRGDLFYKLMIKAPAAENAVGFKDKVAALKDYYSGDIRKDFPQSLSQFN